MAVLDKDKLQVKTYYTKNKGKAFEDLFSINGEKIKRIYYDDKGNETKIIDYTGGDDES